MAPPAVSNDQIIRQLTTSFEGSEGIARSWTGGTVTFSLADSAPTITWNGEGSGFQAMDSHEKDMARIAFQEWADLIDLHLQETTDPNAQITFGYSSKTSDDGTYTVTNPPIPTWLGGSTNQALSFAQVWIASDWDSNKSAAVQVGSAGLTTYIHEIGHSLGLSHPGLYNATDATDPTYEKDAEYSRDTQQYTVMSYFPANSDLSGADYGDSSPSTPMIDDILAIQSKYGANHSTRSGDTVYGFGTNITGALKSIYDFNIDTAPVLTIWDGGGIDTIDASGYSNDQRIDLHAGAYSDIGGLKQNIGIAYGVTIENAAGGSGDDTLTGNSADNRLTGNGGRDTLDGGAGHDTLIGGSGNDTYILADANLVSVTTAFGTFKSTQFDAVVEQANGGLDTVEVGRTTGPSILGGTTVLTSYALPDNVENGIVTGSGAFDLVGNGLDNFLTGNGAANTLTGGAGKDVLDGGAGYDTLVGGADNDTYILGDVSLAPVTTRYGNFEATQFDAVVEQANGGIDTVKVGRTAGPSLLGGTTELTNYLLPANVENGIVTGTGAFDLIGNGLDNSLTGNDASNTLTGGGGHDTLSGGGGYDTLIGGAGDDTYILADASLVQLLTSTGAPTFTYLTTFDGVQEQAGGGIDTVEVGRATGPASLGHGPVTLTSYALDSNIENGTVTGFGAFDLVGNALDNVLTGNNAKNTLTGGAGDDTLIGNGGSDTFAFSGTGFGHDTIADFTAGSALGHDVLSFAQGLAGSFTDLMQHVTEVGSNAVISFGQADTVTLNGVNAANLVASDFTFAWPLRGGAGVTKSAAAPPVRAR